MVGSADDGMAAVTAEVRGRSRSSDSAFEDREDSRGLVGRRGLEADGDCGLVKVAEEEFRIETVTRTDLSFRSVSDHQNRRPIESASSSSHARYLRLQ